VAAWKLRGLWTPGELLRSLTLTALVLAGPFAALLVCAARWAYLRRWGALALLAGFILTTSLGFALVWLARDRRTLEPWEAYDYSGWYNIAWAGAYAAGVLAAVAWALAATVRGARALAGRLRTGG
jgi:hypothetical protein